MERPNAAQLGFELTDDEFLGGRIRLWQPKKGFRAGLDSVVLAAAVRAKPRDNVCDLGTGVGTVALCLAARVPELRMTGVEVERGLAEVAIANGARNDCSFHVAVLDVFARPRQLARQSFDHVVSNPPFHDTARGTRAPDAKKARATSVASKGLAAWLNFARALTKPAGSITVIVPPDQLAVALNALTPQGLGCEIIPLWPRAGEGAKRMILRAKMNARSPLVLCPGLVLHEKDGRPTPEAESILRQGQPLSK